MELTISPCYVEFNISWVCESLHDSQGPETLAPKRHQTSDFDTISTAMAPLKSSKNAGNCEDFCVDIVEVTDSSSVPPTRENAEKTNKTTER